MSLLHHWWGLRVQLSLVPRPRQAFCPFRNRNAGRVWYLSRNHDVIGKWRFFFLEWTGYVSHIQPTTRSMHELPPASKICVVSHLAFFFTVLSPVCPRTIKPFLPLFLSWRHMRKDTRPSPGFSYCKRWKAGLGLGIRLDVIQTLRLYDCQ